VTVERTLVTELVGNTIAQLWTDAGTSCTWAVLAFRLTPSCDQIVALEKRLDVGDLTALVEAEDLTIRPIVVFDLFADCCSETWLADVVNREALRGEVIRVEVVDLPEGFLTDQVRTRQEKDDVMGWEIYTTAGVCSLAVRNSSNGYYGGAVVFDRRVAEPDPTWTEITKDYSA